MTEPDLEPLTPIGQALLELERARRAPLEHKEAVWAQLSASLSLPETPVRDGSPAGQAAPPAAGAGAAGSGAVATTVGISVATLVVGGLVGVALGLVIAPSFGTPPALESVQATAPTPPSLPPPETALPHESSPASPPPPPAPEVARPPARVAPRAPAEAPASEESGQSQLEQERALIEAARRALSHALIPEAIEALSRHDREFPAAQLVEERESLWIQCLLHDGKLEDGRARFDEFRRRFPRSIQLPALEAVMRSAAPVELETEPSVKSPR